MLIVVTQVPTYYIWDLPQVSEDGHVVDNIVETNGHVCPPNPGKQREHFINCCLFSGWNFISVYQQMDHTERGQLVAASLYSIPVQLNNLYKYNFTTFFKTFSPLIEQLVGQSFQNYWWNWTDLKSCSTHGDQLCVFNVCIQYTHVSVGQIEPKYNELWINQILTSLARFLT